MKIDFNKTNGLVPVIIQDYLSLNVLMLGYMNSEAFEITKKENRVTFFSRSKQRLWTKGETSGNFLTVKNIEVDCDNDTILIKVLTNGPVCHTGSTSCFKDESSVGFLRQLEAIINSRITNKDENSYTFQLFKKGINKVSQKVGEESVEAIIEALNGEKELFINEVADLLYHLLILLKSKSISLAQVEKILHERHMKSSH